MTTFKYNTARFGEIEVVSADVLLFPEGLLGFNSFTRYILLQDPEQDPFLWMQSIDDPGLAFVVVDPFIFFPGFEIQVKPQEISTIELEDISKANVLTILTVPDNPMDLTANLRGPLVINSEKKLAKQLVLIDDRYHTRHYLLKDIPDYLSVPFTDINKTVPAQEPVPPQGSAQNQNRENFRKEQHPRRESSRKHPPKRRRDRP